MLFDHSVPDVISKRPRQCDVWIETVVGGHWPITIYISCKDYARKLDASHIDNFRAEIAARGAGSGVIYSRSGFTKGALEKAQGICCCRLFDNQAADIPDVIWWDCYACQVRMRLQYFGTADSELTWGEVFDRVVDGKTFIEHIHETFRNAERQFIDEAAKTGGVPEDFCVEGLIPDCEEDASFKLFGIWQFYRARARLTF